MLRKMLGHSAACLVHLVSCTLMYMYFNVHHKEKMKRTADRTIDDDAFVARFAPALKRAYQKEKERGMTDQVFAESIGVERPQLNRYLDGESMPSVRTVAFAHREYGIAIPYNRVSLQDALPKRGRKKQAETLTQMVLPFTIQMEKAAARVDLKFDPVSARKFAFRLIVDRAG
jgi:transcriptional regulator with XRE-family HTH domain